MSKKLSHQRQRHSARKPLEETVSEEVRTIIASKPFVRAVEDHFAGYFNELGLTVTVIESASDQEVISLRNELLQKLESLLPRGKSPFTWQVAFNRSGKTIEFLFPGDMEKELTEELGTD
jgi:hypothetical protein